MLYKKKEGGEEEDRKKNIRLNQILVWSSVGGFLVGLLFLLLGLLALGGPHGLDRHQCHRRLCYIVSLGSERGEQHKNDTYVAKGSLLTHNHACGRHYYTRGQNDACYP